MHVQGATGSVGSRHEQARVGALRRDVRDLGDPVPPDQGRGERAQPGDARPRADRDRGVSSCCRIAAAAKRAASAPRATGGRCSCSRRSRSRFPWMLLGVAEQRISSSLTGLLLATVPLVHRADRPYHRRTRAARGPERDRARARLRRSRGDRRRQRRERRCRSDRRRWRVVAICYAIGPVILQRYLAGVPALGVIAASLGLDSARLRPDRGVQPARRRCHARAVVGSVVGAGSRVHRGRLPRLLRADRRGRAGPRDGVHLRESGRRSPPRRRDPRRAAHGRYGHRLRAGSRRLGAGRASADARDARRCAVLEPVRDSA